MVKVVTVTDQGIYTTHDRIVCTRHDRVMYTTHDRIMCTTCDRIDVYHSNVVSAAIIRYALNGKDRRAQWSEFTSAK